MAKSSTSRKSQTATSPEVIIDIKGLKKIYGKDETAVHALKGIDLEIPRGSIFGLLGPNGAGKSTLINILGGLTIKSSGTVNICGYDIDRDARNARGVIGIVPQELNMDPFFTPRQTLEMISGLYGVPKKQRITEDILKAVGLLDKADSYARKLSGGMQRRLLVAKAMVHEPEILVLDEPTAGVDITLRKQLWDYVFEINQKKGTTILLTTHYLQEAEEMCDQIAIINHGKLIANKPKKELLSLVDAKTITISFAEKISKIPASLKKFKVSQEDTHILTIHYHQNKTSAGDIITLLQKEKHVITDVSTREADLEQVFLDLTKRKEK